MFKKILIDIRDFSYHYAKKQSGIKLAETEYLFKMMGALSLYYIGVLVLVTHFLRHLFSVSSGQSIPSFLRFLVGLVFVVAPIYFLVKGSIRLVARTPIPDELSKKEYRKKRTITILVFFIGVVFFFLTAFIPTYFLGGKIHLGNFVIQRK